MNPEPRIIVALDFSDTARALDLVDRLDPSRCRLKVSNKMFTRQGPGLVEELTRRELQVFLDLKFHDIPNTVAAACEAAADLGVWMLNLHASGGRAMMETARERLARLSRAPLLVAVTLLTSLDAGELSDIGCPGDPRDHVLRLASLAKRTGLDGVVCSPREASFVRENLGQGFLLVTPGGRPASVASADQKRIMTPRDALIAGTDYLVIGRPITAAPVPLPALMDIGRDMDNVCKGVGWADNRRRRPAAVAV